MAGVSGNTFQSDVGAKEGKEGYIGLLFAHLGRMSFALNNTELGSQSANIYYNSLLIINHIPDVELRKELMKKLKARIDELEMKEKKTKEAAIITASIEIVGDVMDHIDEMLGIEKKAKISIELDCHSCKFRKAVEDMEDTEDIPTKDDTIPNEMSEDVPVKISKLCDSE